ncbi:hypothetical protein [Propionicimonas sp.]|uniref:hypothetical protein n=1 Tax=Propionicimonas sp. TaxID=1955623 RepID=UPI0039E6F465
MFGVFGVLGVVAVTGLSAVAGVGAVVALGAVLAVTLGSVEVDGAVLPAVADPVPDGVARAVPLLAGGVGVAVSANATVVPPRTARPRAPVRAQAAVDRLNIISEFLSGGLSMSATPPGAGEVPRKGR